jgi:hypothetical protein
MTFKPSQQGWAAAALGIDSLLDAHACTEFELIWKGTAQRDGIQVQQRLDHRAICKPAVRAVMALLQQQATQHCLATKAQLLSAKTDIQPIFLCMTIVSAEHNNT